MPGVELRLTACDLRPPRTGELIPESLCTNCLNPTTPYGQGKILEGRGPATAGAQRAQPRRSVAWAGGGAAHGQRRRAHSPSAAIVLRRKVRPVHAQLGQSLTQSGVHRGAAVTSRYIDTRREIDAQSKFAHRAKSVRLQRTNHA